MLQVRVDTFPVVVTTFGEGFTDVDLAAYREALASVLGRAERYVSVLDTSAVVTMPSLALREEILALVRQHAAAMSNHCLSTEVVVRSVPVRAAFSAVQWLATSESRVSLHASLRPAVSRAMDIIWTHGLPISPELRAFHDQSIVQASVPPPMRSSGSYGKRQFESSIEGLFRRVRRSGDGSRD